MNTYHLIIELFTFLLTVGSVMYAYYYLEVKYKRYVIMRRIFPSDREAGNYEKNKVNADVTHILITLGLKALPQTEDEIADIKKLLGYAGYRSEQAPVIYFGLKLALALIGGGLYLFAVLLTGRVGLQSIICMFFPTAIGYFLPGLVLKHQVTVRHRQIFKELPDMLDLLLICMQAGLSFDMALNRVSRELAAVAPVLSREFGRYFLEIKGGLPRKQVLENLAERNGEKNLTGVVQVLIQSADFGTDITEAIRIYSEALRTERKQMAEEKGAKISTKLTFPTVLLILPALMLIILGPAVIRLLERM